MLKGYFVLIGIAAITTMVTGMIRSFVSHEKVLFRIPKVPYVSDPVDVTPALLVSFTIGCGVSLWYAVTNHWLANNLLGIAFCVNGMALINIGSYSIGALLLAGLFAYDIFMVFFSGRLTGGESVMVAVATKLDGPIKLLFPLPVDMVMPGKRAHSLLGLGDIIVPGIFICHLLRFDHFSAAGKLVKKKDEKKDNAAVAVDGAPEPYFNAALLAYTLGLILTVYIMYAYDSAQPALLYLVPAVLGCSFIQAVTRGEVKAMLAYKAEGDEEDNKKTAAGTTGTATTGTPGDAAHAHATVDSSGSTGSGDGDGSDKGATRRSKRAE